jgi:hypothetical protein
LKVSIASKVLAVTDGYLDPFRPVFRMNVIHCHEGRKLPRPSSNADDARPFSSMGTSLRKDVAIRRRLVRPQDHARVSAHIPSGKIRERQSPLYFPGSVGASLLFDDAGSFG